MTEGKRQNMGQQLVAKYLQPLLVFSCCWHLQRQYTYLHFARHLRASATIIIKDERRAPEAKTQKYWNRWMLIASRKPSKMRWSITVRAYGKSEWRCCAMYAFLGPRKSESRGYLYSFATSIEALNPDSIMRLKRIEFSYDKTMNCCCWIIRINIQNQSICGTTAYGTEVPQTNIILRSTREKNFLFSGWTSNNGSPTYPWIEFLPAKQSAIVELSLWNSYAAADVDILSMAILRLTRFPFQKRILARNTLAFVNLTAWCYHWAGLHWDSAIPSEAGGGHRNLVGLPESEVRMTEAWVISACSCQCWTGWRIWRERAGSVLASFRWEVGHQSLISPVTRPQLEYDKLKKQ